MNRECGVDLEIHATAGLETGATLSGFRQSGKPLTKTFFHIRGRGMHRRCNPPVTLPLKR